METRRAGARDSQRLNYADRPRKRRVREVLICGCCGVVVAAGLLRGCCGRFICAFGCCLALPNNGQRCAQLLCSEQIRKGHLNGSPTQQLFAYAIYDPSQLRDTNIGTIFVFAKYIKKSLGAFCLLLYYSPQALYVLNCCG